jgi:MFS transporter, NNP family, nitrate/nitrite transporter
MLDSRRRGPCMATHDAASWRNLGYATFSMALAFAAWGLISAFAPSFRSQFNLSAQSTAFLVAVPVLLGSLARLPIGILTDLAFGFLLGVAGASFAVGVGFSSRWFPPEQTGHGARHLRPRQHGPFGRRVSRPGGRRASGATPCSTDCRRDVAAWACCSSRSRATPRAGRAPATIRRHDRGVFTREPLAWALSAFYFLTFGGFVAFSVYLPTLLRDEFG